MTIDVAAFVGGYPFRYLPDSSPAWLLRQMARPAIGIAWVAHLPSARHRHPAAVNAQLMELLSPHANGPRPVPTTEPAPPGRQEIS